VAPLKFEIISSFSCQGRWRHDLTGICPRRSSRIWSSAPQRVDKELQLGGTEIGSCAEDPRKQTAMSKVAEVCGAGVPPKGSDRLRRRHEQEPGAGPRLQGAAPDRGKTTMARISLESAGKVWSKEGHRRASRDETILRWQRVNSEICCRKRDVTYQARRESTERSTVASGTSHIRRAESQLRDLLSQAGRHISGAQRVNSEVGRPKRQVIDDPKKAIGSSERARKTTAAIVQLT
jgi:hypothetical protein